MKRKNSNYVGILSDQGEAATASDISVNILYTGTSNLQENVYIRIQQIHLHWNQLNITENQVKQYFKRFWKSDWFLYCIHTKKLNCLRSGVEFDMNDIFYEFKYLHHF